jgi:hypothetical protein
LLISLIGYLESLLRRRTLPKSWMPTAPAATRCPKRRQKLNYHSF